MKISLLLIVQARIEELLEYRLLSKVDAVTDAYCEVMLTYLQADAAGLSSAIEKMASLDPGEDWMDLCNLRFQVLQMNTNGDLIARVKMMADSADFDTVFRAECAFVAAMALEQHDDHIQSRDCYGKATRLYDQAGAHKKAVKALQNYVAEESRVHPEKKLLSDYHLIYRKARKLREYSVAGMALNNISREYQILGALGAALKYVNRALAYLERERGSRCFYLALAHRCHIYADLERTREARLDLEELAHADFPEIRATIDVLKKIVYAHDPCTPVSDRRALTFTWRERLQEVESGASRLKSTDLEGRLIEILSEKPMDKFEIIETLYGSNIGFEAAENRLKNLLNRIRKKHPGMLVLENGKYRIVDESALNSA